MVQNVLNKLSSTPGSVWLGVLLFIMAVAVAYYVGKIVAAVRIRRELDRQLQVAMAELGQKSEALVESMIGFNGAAAEASRAMKDLGVAMSKNRGFGPYSREQREATKHLQ